MIKHICKIIWNEKRSNAWIMLELVIVFCILWFCSYFLYSMGKRMAEPMGFDISSTYTINLGSKPEKIVGKLTKEERYASMLEIVDRLKTFPEVEAVSYSAYAIPYSGSYWGRNYKADTTMLMGIWTKWVSPDYFKVFKIDFLKGNTFDANQMLNPNTGILGINKSGYINNLDLKGVTSLVDPELNLNISVIGTVTPIKRFDSDIYPFASLFLPVTADQIFAYTEIPQELAIRVKEGYDEPDFAEKFQKKISSQMDVSPFYLQSVKPVSELREHMLNGLVGISAKIKSSASIVLFILINIFLGIIGTFWLRTQSRSSEIGLQMALGASRSRIRKTYISEALLMVFVASILGFVLALNLHLTGIFDNLGLPIISSESKAYTEAPWYEIYIVYLIALAVISVITIVGVWYPSLIASRVKPAKVLRGE